MNTWCCLSLGDGLTSGAAAAEIEAKFPAAFEAAGRPGGMAIFTRTEQDGRMHCEVMAYFSPAAGELARALGANPCGPPGLPGLVLLAGPETAATTLFPLQE